LAVPYVGILLTILGFVGLAIRNRKRRLHTLTTGKPPFDPRNLWWMDSWQATLRDLGSYCDDVVKGITTRIEKDAPADLSIAVERIGYWSVDGRVERDQYAVRYRRSLGFIHVAPYGNNLYVSWECHLNRGAWAEEMLAKGVDRVTGQDVVANRVVNGLQALNEYDVADANFLSEWMHEAVKTELKLKLAEHKIDQEIDFTVQRESRKSALSNTRESETPDDEGKTKKLFKRIG
jgi:hypothetical protein